jgi:tetratricopeptide (TPR) repeat protein
MIDHVARSIHQTRRDLAEQEASDYADPEQQAAQSDRIADELGKKRRIKYRVQTERRGGGRRPPPLSPEAIPIRVRDTGPSIHYPAGPADLLGVMRRLPVGVLDGLDSIDLCLGVEDQEESGLEADPLVGRPGQARWPGVYSGQVLGCYHRDTAKIRLMAYVYDVEMPDRSLKELFLRLQMLATFVHEVAHHYDWTTRTARGRWRMDSTTRDEIYAENVEHDWVQGCVIPYLESAYPEEVRALDAWITHHGGISISLARLAGDPRSAAEGNAVRLAFGGIPGALERLVESVDGGAELVSARIEFARELHYGEDYAEALAILERVLAEHPENEEALTLQADIAVHQEEYDRAEILCQRVISTNEKYAGAWEVLCDVHWSRRDWGKLAQTASHALPFFESDEYGRSHVLLQRARAYLELNDIQAFLRDRDALTRSGNPRRTHMRALALEAVRLLHAGDFGNALQVALQGAEGYRYPEVELVAVRFEAAHKLGRPYEAGEMSPRRIEQLRCRGYEEWADRLVEQYSLHAGT